MKNKIEEKVYDKIIYMINEEKFDIEYVEYVKEGNQNILRVVIDRIDGLVSIDDCELISRKIEDEVDKLIESEYILEVQSPGLERELRNVRLYKKYINSEIFLRLYKKGVLGKELTGILKSVNKAEDGIDVEIDDSIHEIKFSDIASSHTVYDFKTLLKESKNKVNINKLNKF